MALSLKEILSFESSIEASPLLSNFLPEAQGDVPLPRCWCYMPDVKADRET